MWQYETFDVKYIFMLQPKDRIMLLESKTVFSQYVGSIYLWFQETFYFETTEMLYNRPDCFCLWVKIDAHVIPSIMFIL